MFFEALPKKGCLNDIRLPKWTFMFKKAHAGPVLKIAEGSTDFDHYDDVQLENFE